MHVLMKHCWPAAHCQLHCCLDDWSIEGLQAFVMPPPCSDSSTLFLSLSLSLSLWPCHGFVSNLSGIVIHVRRMRGEGAAAEAYISMLENVQNNVQEPNVHFFQRCTPSTRLRSPRFSLPLSLYLSRVPLGQRGYLGYLVSPDKRNESVRPTPRYSCR